MGLGPDGRSPSMGANMFLAGRGSGARCETRRTGGRRAAVLIMLRRARRKRRSTTPAVRKRMACRLMLDADVTGRAMNRASTGAPAPSPEVETSLRREAARRARRFTEDLRPIHAEIPRRVKDPELVCLCHAHIGARETRRHCWQWAQAWAASFRLVRSPRYRLAPDLGTSAP